MFLFADQFVRNSIKKGVYLFELSFYKNKVQVQQDLHRVDHLYCNENCRLCGTCMTSDIPVTRVTSGNIATMFSNRVKLFSHGQGTSNVLEGNAKRRHSRVISGVCSQPNVMGRNSKVVRRAIKEETGAGAYVYS